MTKTYAGKNRSEESPFLPRKMLTRLPEVVHYMRKHGVSNWGMCRLSALNVLRFACAAWGRIDLHFSGVCPICDGNAFFDFENPRFRILMCHRCGHAFAKDSFSRNDILDRYAKLAFWDIDRHHQNIFEIGPGPHWDGFVDHRMRVLRDMEALPPPIQIDGRQAKILEIGSSEGILLNHLTGEGYETVGCEVNKEIVARAGEYYSNRVITEDFLQHDFGHERFDLIASFHTFEHMVDPCAATEKCFGLLQPGGIFFIEVPHGPKEYLNIDHLHFFSLESVRRLVKKRFVEIQIHDNEYVMRGVMNAGTYLVRARKQSV